MKLKGISIIEQHVEKVVLAAFFLVLIFVLVQQLGLIGGPATVRANNKDVPISQAYAEVRELAERKASELSSPDVAGGVPERAPAVLDLYEQSRSAGTGSAQILALGEAQLDLGDAGADGPIVRPETGGSNQNAAFVAITPPQTSRPVSATYGFTLDPVAVQRAGPELQRMLPTAQPFDVRSVSIETRFPAEDFRAMLASPGDGAAGVPDEFWKRRSEILDVVWERQTLIEGGQWSDAVELAPMVGAASVRDELDREGMQNTDLSEILRIEAESRSDIRRPEMYQTISGEPWTWPSAGAEANPALLEQVNTLVNDLRSFRARIDQLIQQNNGDDPRGDDGAPGGGGGDLNPVEQRIVEFDGRATSAVDALNDLGFDEEGRPLDAGDEPVFEEPLLSLAEPDTPEVTLWTHDLGAQPGETYRYRARVRITNPYFGFEDKLPEDARELARQFVVDSAPSEWSDPVEIAPDVMFFVASANPVARNQPIAAGARATLEIFEFFYGYWRRAQVSLSPGDSVEGSVSLPELKTWQISEADNGQIALGDETEVGASRTIRGDGFLVDVVSVPGAPGAAQVFLASSDGTRLISRMAREAETSQRFAEVLANAQLGAAAVPSIPSTDRDDDPDRR